MFCIQEKHFNYVLEVLPRVGGGARTHDLQIHNLAL